MNRALVVLALGALAACKTRAPLDRPSLVPIGPVASPTASLPAPAGPCAAPSEREALTAEDAAGKTIRAICIHLTPAQMAADVLLYLREKQGDLYEAERLASDVRALHDSGFFRSVNVTARGTVSGIELHFELTLRPLVHATTLEGAVHVRPDPDNPIAQVGTIHSRSDLKRRVVALRELYVAEGFEDATVESSVSQTPAGVDVRVTVNEGRRTTVGSLALRGVSAAFETDLRNLPELAPGAPVGASSLGAARARIEQVYEDRAYYGHVQLERGPRGSSGAAPLTLEVAERGPFKVGTLTVAVDPALDRDLAQVLRLKPGDPANGGRIRADVQRVTDALRARGRRESVSVAPSLDPAQKIIDLKIQLERP